MVTVKLMTSYEEFMGYDKYKDISKINANNTTSKKLYVYYTANDLDKKDIWWFQEPYSKWRFG